MKLFIGLLFAFLSIMAFAQTTITSVKIPGVDQNASLVSFRMISSDQTAAAQQMPGYQHKTVQASGTFAGATVTVEGSNDGTSYFTLKNAFQASGDVTFAAAGVKKVLENPRYIRVKTTGTAASTDVTASILFAK